MHVRPGRLLVAAGVVVVAGCGDSGSLSSPPLLKPQSAAFQHAAAGTLRGKNGDVATIDTVKNELRPAHGRPQKIAHSIAVKLFKSWGTLDAMNAKVAEVESHPAIQAAKARSVGRQVHRQMRAGSHAQGQGSSGNHALIQRFVPALPSASRNRAARGLNPGTTGAIAALAPSGHANFNLGDYCSDLEMDIYEKTSEYESAKADYQTFLNEPRTPFEEGSTEYWAFIIENTAHLHDIADLYLELEYDATEWNLNSCDGPQPAIPDLGEVNTGQSDLYEITPLSGFCYDEYWDIYESWDNGLTWDYVDSYTVTVCDDEQEQ